VRYTTAYGLLFFFASRCVFVALGTLTDVGTRGRTLMKGRRRGGWPLANATSVKPS